MSEIKEMVLDFLGEDEQVLFFEDLYDEAIIGLSENNKVVYSYDGMIDCLMNKTDCTSDEATQTIDCTLASLSEKENYPIIVNLF